MYFLEVPSVKTTNIGFASVWSGHNVIKMSLSFIGCLRKHWDLIGQASVTQRSDNMNHNLGCKFFPTNVFVDLRPLATPTHTLSYILYMAGGGL